MSDISNANISEIVRANPKIASNDFHLLSNGNIAKVVL